MMVSCVLAMGVVGYPLGGMASESQADAEMEAASAPDPYVDPAMEVEAAFNRFFSEGFGKSLQQRMAAGELYVGKTWAEVQVAPQNSQWPKYRVMAYESALSDAENGYLMSLSAKIKSEKVRSYFADNSGEVPDFDDSLWRDQNKVARIIDKMLTLTEGRLDKALEELGIDPEEYGKTPKSQRHDLFKDALTKSSVKEAMGSLAGLVPVQTFEAQNKSGEHVIGVVVVASQKMRQFAHEIGTRRGKLTANEAKKGRPVHDVVAGDAALLIDQFGIRRLYDEHGYPVLISYGQWGNAYRGDNKRQARRQRAAALDQARMQADQQIAMFVAGKAMVTEESTVGQIVEQYVDVHKDGYKEEQEVSRIVDELNKRSRAKANVRLSGLADVYSWTQPHPVYPEHELIGVVRLWSPLNEQNMRNLKNFQPKQEAASKPQVKSGGMNDLHQGKSYMRADDF
ncbi:hypothetical protein DJ031_11030 [bacterium endosymbiont of Escarpia laminata]|nr:MAG: hypothetical protein DJ031_11030 [bacterium endosymbiont of Escarpia laminata]